MLELGFHPDPISWIDGATRWYEIIRARQTKKHLPVTSSYFLALEDDAELPSRKGQRIPGLFPRSEFKAINTVKPQHHPRVNMSDDIEKIEFSRFLQKLVDSRRLEDPADGITKLIIDKGREVLSQKQEIVFQRQVIDEHVHETCSMCHQKIPWCEMYQAIDGGLCAYCVDQLDEG